MASYQKLSDLVDDFAHDCKRHIQLQQDRITELEIDLELERNSVAQATSAVAVLKEENTALQNQVEALRRDNAAELKHEDLLEIMQNAKPGNFHTSDEVGCKNCDRLLAFDSRYRELYRSFSIAIKTVSSARIRLQEMQERVDHWKLFFNQSSFEVDVDGELIAFQRVGTYPAPAVQSEATGSRESANPPTPNHASDEANIDTQLPSDDPELISTQSQDPAYETNDNHPSLVPSLGSPVFMSARPVRRRDIIQNTSAQATRNLVETGSFMRPVTVKSEPSSENSNHAEVNMGRDLNTEGRQGLPERVEAISGNSVEKAAAPCMAPIGSVFHTGGMRPVSPRGKRRQPLRDIDRNIPPSPQRELANGKRRKFASRGAVSVPSVAEDGEEENYGTRRLNRAVEDQELSSHRQQKGAQGLRILDLLDTPPPPRPVLLTTPRRAGFQASTPAGISARKNLRRSIDANNSIDGGPRRGSLRSRPLRALGLEHFKLNPERNHGLDYAYDEVVRDKSARKCLPGCLAQSCCGPTFRAMARSEIPKNVTFDTLTQEYRQLLEEYHGVEKSKLQSLPDDRIYNLLVEAKAWEFSNRFGRHRHAHARESSPPGFWRTDMPTTQEEEADRQRALELEQEKVYERYQQALRGDGVWRFADE
ncbi:hypothetical protein LOZ12_001620 [Ophidiomyces ophidiicola]|nr:hypothetical protein LOZ62_001875 [Ophidiomyces ophidiicola]KAI1965479.1 hypothetical protein LOZ59_001290 [Ophidiomyces ophidiicola]KAI1973919.1 hypothetical protein LOZ56_001534 [Ophidiomyces ophidiicola]KAI2001583.1 hypothetical protein LOZ50_005582 [Ophidiomyces ophidiicola]KAI2027975.1 hypothetical protein LOZ45_002371 [Ophidiomyces ophidiicola]